MESKPKPVKVEPYSAKLTIVQLPSNNSTEEDCPYPSVIYLRGNKIQIGRLDASDVQLKCVQASRKHCLLTYKDSKWWLNHTSTNGLSINDVMIDKLTPTELVDQDIIFLIPEVLAYKLEYTETNSLPEPSVQNLPQHANDDDGTITLDDTASDIVSETSIDENDLITLDSPPPVLTNMKTRGKKHKRSADILKPQKQVNKKKRLENDEMKRNHRHKIIIDTMDSDIEDDLMDVDNSEPLQSFFPSQIQKTGKHGDKDGIKKESPTKVGKVTTPLKSKSNSAAAALPAMDVTKEDVDVLNDQIEKWKKMNKVLEDEKQSMLLQVANEKKELQDQIDELKIQVAAQKEGVVQTMVEILESELSCCICNEVYVEPSLIDCGHTFCNHCIMEWIKKKNDCPICRKVIQNIIKHVVLNNFITKVHTSLSTDVKNGRENVLKDRADEIAMAAAVAVEPTVQVNPIIPVRGGRVRGRGRRGRGQMQIANIYID